LICLSTVGLGSTAADVVASRGRSATPSARPRPCPSAAGAANAGHGGEFMVPRHLRGGGLATKAYPGSCGRRTSTTSTTCCSARPAWKPLIRRIRHSMAAGRGMVVEGLQGASANIRPGTRSTSAIAGRAAGHGRRARDLQERREGDSRRRGDGPELLGQVRRTRGGTFLSINFSARRRSQAPASSRGEEKAVLSC